MQFAVCRFADLPHPKGGGSSAEQFCALDGVCSSGHSGVWTCEVGRFLLAFAKSKNIYSEICNTLQRLWCSGYLLEFPMLLSWIESSAGRLFLSLVHWWRSMKFLCMEDIQYYSVGLAQWYQCHLLTGGILDLDPGSLQIKIKSERNNTMYLYIKSVQKPAERTNYTRWPW